MKRLAVLSAAALLVSACGAKKLTADEVRVAMPASAALRIEAPTAAGSASAATGVAAAQGDPLLTVAAASADPYSLALTSYLLATGVNSGVFWALAPIAWLTENVPPTSCTDEACTWGPGSNAAELNDWMLVVTRSGEGFDYTLSGAPKSPAGAPFVALMTGTAFPGGEAHRGHGSFHVDFDAAWAGLAHAATDLQTDYGTLKVDYDVRTRLALDVTFVGALNRDAPGTNLADPNRTNAVYHFDATAAGGDLRVGWRTAEPSVGVAKGSFTLHTQWQASGAGVADARFGTPDLQAGSTIVTFSQCWAGSPYALTYDSYPGSTLVDTAACAIAPGAPVEISIP